jgi:hypothetical protein
MPMMQSANVATTTRHGGDLKIGDNSSKRTTIASETSHKPTKTLNALVDQGSAIAMSIANTFATLSLSRVMVWSLA